MDRNNIHSSGPSPHSETSGFRNNIMMARLNSGAKKPANQETADCLCNNPLDQDFSKNGGSVSLKILNDE